MYNSDQKDLYVLKTALPPPFRIINLKTFNSKANLDPLIPCLKLKKPLCLDHLNFETNLEWLYHPHLIHELASPQAILDSWFEEFKFKEDIPEINQTGLRKPQLGALHAIAAYFSSEKNIEPATVVLPTGTGKTETMLATLLYQRCHKILVLVPSNALRDQITKKFLTLGCLPDLGVVSPICPSPYVAKIVTGLGSEEEALCLAGKSNIIIATPNVLNCGNQDAVEKLCMECSHLFIDEAHHVSAISWQRIRTFFVNKKIIQFTATPFRNDRDALGGKIIYNYTMGEAQKAGYFKTIHLHPIEEYHEDKSDIAIAQKAVDILKKDLEQGYDHILMARAKSKKRADEIFEIYKSISNDLNPILIHSDYSKSQNLEMLSKLKSRESRIAVCVDMLGEGYDLPNLKIAAIHDYHKSLAIMLQFIGRFTRSTNASDINDASVVVNIADPSTENALMLLYAQDADWDAILRRLSEERIDREIELQEVVDSLKRQGNLSAQLSLWNLRPFYSAVLFATKCELWTPLEYQKTLSEKNHWFALSQEKNILILLALQDTPVKWGNFNDLIDVNYKVLIAHWDKGRGALFLFSNDYKAFKIGELSKKLCGDTTELMSGMKIFNVLNNISYPLVKNLGSTQVGNISFTQFFGTNVTEGLTSVEKSSSELSNIAALGYENGDKVLWGCSQRKGKIWSPQKSGKITDWLRWAQSAWDKVLTGDPEDTNITRDFLRPNKLESNHPISPMSIQWGERMQQAFEDKAFIMFNDIPVPFYDVDIGVDEGENHSVLIKITSEKNTAIYQLSIDKSLRKGYEYKLIDGPPVSFDISGHKKDFEEEMYADPFLIYYCDGSFSYNCYHVAISNNIGIYDATKLNEIDWSGIDITKESMGVHQEKNTVQYRVFSDIEVLYDVIVNDDGPGEAADLIALKQLDKEIILDLYHCKFSSQPHPGRRLNDLYEICGQAQRCVRWKHVGLPYLYFHIKHREGKWVVGKSSRFLKGNMAQMAALKNMSRGMPVKFKVHIVQPGVSASRITEEMLKLLGTTELFIKKTTTAELEVICSA